MGITEFGHLRLDAPDVPEAYRFWSTTFNARVLDWVGDGACLMRIDPVHHKLAGFRGDEAALCPVNFQVASYDDLFRNWHFRVDRDVQIVMDRADTHLRRGIPHLPPPRSTSPTTTTAVGGRLITDRAAWTPRCFDAEELSLPRHVARPGRADHAAASSLRPPVTVSARPLTPPRRRTAAGGTAWARAIALGTACGT